MWLMNHSTPFPEEFALGPTDRLLCIHSCSTQRLPGLASTGMDMRLTQTWTSADPMVMLVSVSWLNLGSSWPDGSAQQECAQQRRGVYL